MWRLLHNMEFSYKMTDSKRVIYEQHDIIEQRLAYLQATHKLRQEKTLHILMKLGRVGKHTCGWLWFLNLDTNRADYHDELNT